MNSPLILIPAPISDNKAGKGARSRATLIACFCNQDDLPEDFHTVANDTARVVESVPLTAAGQLAPEWMSFITSHTTYASTRMHLSGSHISETIDCRSLPIDDAQMRACPRALYIQ